MVGGPSWCLSSGSTRLGNVDLEATLQDGVLTVAHFRGALLGGSLALSGVVDGHGVTRGQAKDPPGMVNTLTAPATDRPRQQPQQQHPQRSPVPNLPLPNLPIPNPFGR